MSESKFNPEYFAKTIPEISYEERPGMRKGEKSERSDVSPYERAGMRKGEVLSNKSESQLN